MKKELLVTGILGLAGIIFLGFVLANSARFKNFPKKQTPNAIPQNMQSFTTSDVALHKTKDDCHMIIHNRVYTMTAFLKTHKEDISPYCGNDATEAFVNRNGRGPHDAKAEETLQTLMIGTLTQ